MATPFFSVQGAAITLSNASPGQITILSKDATGAAIDIHTGYTVNNLPVAPSASPNILAGNVDLSSHMTATFSATGVTLSWTAAQASTMVGLLPSLSEAGVLRLTNDGGTTESMIAQVTVNVNTASLVG